MSYTTSLEALPPELRAAVQSPAPNHEGLGFWGAFGTVANVVVQAAGVGVTAYSAYEQNKLAEEQWELQEDLQLKKAELEESLFQAQQRIVDIEAAGAEERQNIELEVERAKAESAQRQIERIQELEDMRLALEKAKIESEQEKVILYSDLEKQVAIERAKAGELPVQQSEAEDSGSSPWLVGGGIAAALLLALFAFAGGR